MTEYLDYGFGEFEFIEDPYSKTYINGGSPMTNVPGYARIQDRKHLGHRRRHPEHYERMNTTARFAKTMMSQFIQGMKRQLNRSSFLTFSQYELPPDTRTDWERALDQCFYDPAERDKDTLYFSGSNWERED